MNHDQAGTILSLIGMPLQTASRRIGEDEKLVNRAAMDDGRIDEAADQQNMITSSSIICLFCAATAC